MRAEKKRSKGSWAHRNVHREGFDWRLESLNSQGEVFGLSCGKLMSSVSVGYLLAGIVRIEARTAQGAGQQRLRCQIRHWNGVQGVRVPINDHFIMSTYMKYLAYDVNPTIQRPRLKLNSRQRRRFSMAMEAAQWFGLRVIAPHFRHRADSR